MIKKGKLKFKKSTEIKNSVFGVGLEKLDRNMYDPSPVYPELKNAGVKYARIQSGWARTETKKGEYDFKWLDDIVDNLIKNGIEPWMCLCYGNGLYNDRAKEHFYGVGCPPINTDEEKRAWINYCKQVAARYKGKVNKYEIWNEPDGDWCWVNGQNPIDYGTFAISTAKALKEVLSDVYVIAGSTAFLKPEWIDKMLSTGLSEYIDAVSYHRYTAHLEDGVLKLIPPYRAILDKYGVKDLVQGESGCQSETGGAGALWEGEWNELKQAKMLLRRELIDLISNVKIASYFTAVDVDEALIGVSGKAYFGLLKNVCDKSGKPTGKYKRKPSFYAMRAVCSAIGGAKVIEGEIEFLPEWSLRYYREDDDGKDFISAFLKSERGGTAYCYYKPTDIMTTSYQSTVSFKISGVSGKPKLIDLMDGSVYEFTADEVFVTENGYRFKNIPVKDYPLLVCFGDFAETK